MQTDWFYGNDSKEYFVLARYIFEGEDALRRRPSFDPDLFIPKQLTLSHQNEILKQVCMCSSQTAVVFSTNNIASEVKPIMCFKDRFEDIYW